MKRLKKSSRVSWASGSNLCQVKLFLSEDCPSKVGRDVQHHLRVKTSWISNSNGPDSNARPTRYKNLLEARHFVNPPKESHPHIPQIKWKCPPTLVLNHDWDVAAGEESEEAETQKHREMRILEAVYPRISTIPPSPFMSFDVDDCNHDDSIIPLIPITPIEEVVAVNLPYDMAAPLKTSVNSKSITLPQGLSTSGNENTMQCDHPVSPKQPTNEIPTLEMLSGLDGDLVVAAASISALIKSNEKGSSIDTNLLMQFLSDPKMIEKLRNECEAAANTGTGTGPQQATPPVTLPSSTSELETKKHTDKQDRPVNARTVSISSPKDEMLSKKSSSDLGVPSHVGPAFNAGSETRSKPDPLQSPKPDVALINNLINKHGADGSRPMAQSVPLPSSKPNFAPIKNFIKEHGASAREPSLVPLPGAKNSNVLMIKKLINKHGAPNNTGKEPLPGSDPPLLVPLSASKPDALLSPGLNLLPASKRMKPLSPDSVRPYPFTGGTSPPVKDANYYRTLIKRHGERQETQDHNILPIGKPDNSLRCSELVQDLKSKESKYQKPCLEFNSSMGGQSVSACPDQHDMSKQWGPGGLLEAEAGSKRMKLGGEICGGT